MTQLPTDDKGRAAHFKDANSDAAAALVAADGTVQVNVASIIPGTGATNLGKAVDSVAGATDTGIAPLAVRDDALAALTPVEGDYVLLRTDANGALWTHDDALDAALAGSELQVDVVAALPAGTNLIGKVQPFAAIIEAGVVQLVGINDQVDQNDYGASVAVTLAGTYSGEILSILLISTEDGTGAVQTPSGHLILFDADPAIVAGDTSITNAEHLTKIGHVEISAAEWTGDANGKTVSKQVAIPFHALGTIYAAWFHTGATSFNDAAGDDEQLELNLWYRRDS